MAENRTFLLCVDMVAKTFARLRTGRRRALIDCSLKGSLQEGVKIRETAQARGLRLEWLACSGWCGHGAKEFRVRFRFSQTAEQELHRFHS